MNTTDPITAPITRRGIRFPDATVRRPVECEQCREERLHSLNHSVTLCHGHPRCSVDWRDAEEKAMREAMDNAGGALAAMRMLAATTDWTVREIAESLRLPVPTVHGILIAAGLRTIEQ